CLVSAQFTALSRGSFAMFGFRRSKPAPAVCRGNPTHGTGGKVAFSNAAHPPEKFDLVQLAARVFQAQKHDVANEKTWLLHRASGFMLLPGFVEIEPVGPGYLHTMTTMQVNHPTFIPNGIFEFQHAWGKSVREAATQGFEQWLQMDFATLLAAFDRPSDQVM